MEVFIFKSASQSVERHQRVVNCALNMQNCILNSFCKFDKKIKIFLMYFSAQFTNQLTDFWAILYLRFSCDSQNKLRLFS
jgi:hypothetical protein